MSENLWRQMRVLKRVSKINDVTSRRKELEKLSHDPSFVKAVQELCLNLVDRQLPLSEDCKKHLSKCKRQIKCCAKEGASTNTRRRQIVNSAVFLPHSVPHAEKYLKKRKKYLDEQNGIGEDNDSNANI